MLAQPARLKASSIGISLCLGDLFLCMLSYLIDFCLAAQFFLPSLQLCLGPGRGQTGRLFIPLRLPGLALPFLPIVLAGPVERHPTTG
ncbi:hypothetical protein D3C72_2173880 [compost metagenome]